MIKIILVGAGGHAKSCIDVIETTKTLKIAGIIDKNVGKKRISGYQVIGSDKNLAKYKKKYKYAFIVIGQIKSSKIRKSIYNNLISLGYKLPIIKSKHAYVSKNSNIGIGTIIMHGAAVNTNVKIGKNCIINTKSLIEHDVKIGNHCHISTGAIINGGVSIGDGTFVGSGSIIKEGIKIGKECVVGAGCIVKKNISSNKIITI